MRAFDWDLPTTDSGPIVGGESEDLDYTLLQWPMGAGVADHVNDEVDVIMVVLHGSGEVIVDDMHLEVSAGKALVLPKGVRRGIRSTSDDFRYLNVHKRRRGLMPDMVRKP